MHWKDILLVIFIHGIREVKEVEMQILYKGKVVKEIKECIYEFNPEFNESNTYYLFFEDGSKTTVSKSVAECLWSSLQNLKGHKNKNNPLQDAINECNEKPFDRTMAAPKHNIEKLNVLGTEYDVELLEHEDETMKSLNCVGYTDKTTKEIKSKLYKNERLVDNKNPKVNTNITLRHELIHAFLYECGIDFGMQFHNEECVDFFAMQFPKLAKIFEDAGCKE